MTNTLQPATYRHFIVSEFESRRIRNPSYSLRAFARDLELAPPKLSEIIRGKCGLSEASATRVAGRLGLSEEETEHFILSVTAQHSRNRLLRTKAQEKLTALEEHRSFDEISLESFKIISDWYHFAILELSETVDFQSDTVWIAKRLNISVQTAQEAVKRLFDFELLKENKRGNWLQTQANLHTSSGIPSSDIRKYHRQVLNKAEETLVSIPINDRDFSSVTISVSEGDIEYARSAIKKFRRDLALKLSKSNEKHRVYNLAIQFFPLDRKEPIYET